MSMTADAFVSRRDLFSWGLRGLGATAFVHLLGRDGVLRGAEG
jgi:hypothetical protein